MLKYIRLYLLVILSNPAFAQLSSTLPRGAPEAEGVSSAGITRFLDAAKASKHEFHSFMVVRHGKVVAEGWWKPYGPNLTHTMYSVSKSFTATAVGFAVSEGKLKLEDKVVSFFPQYLPDTVSQWLSGLTLQHLLTMSVGHLADPTRSVASSEENWIRGFLKVPIVNEPGTRFLYNSLATYMLSAIVQKVTGQKVIDYLQPRLFTPLGIRGIDWETDPMGVNTGGWGLRLKTEDMAKFGLLFLQKGKWQGKQIVSPSWVEQASTVKILQDPSAAQSKRDSSDWLQGYAFQMWRSRHNSYRGDGAVGQYILILPEKDAVIAITSETTDMQSELNLVWDYLLPALREGNLPPSPSDLKELKSRTASLSLPVPETPPSIHPSTIAKMQTSLRSKSYKLEDNSQGLKKIQFNWKGDLCQVTLKNDTATYTFAFGKNRWSLGETQRYGPYLVAPMKGNRVGLPAFKVAGSYHWMNEKTLVLRLRYIESPHTEVITRTLDGNNISMDFQDMFNREQERKPVKGRVEAEVAIGR